MEDASGTGVLLGLEDGVDGVRDAPGSVDCFGVFHPELHHSIVGPDGSCSGIFGEGAEVGKIGRCEVFVDCKLGADSVGDWIWDFWQNIIFV